MGRPDSRQGKNERSEAKAAAFKQLDELRKRIKQGDDEATASKELEPGRRYQLRLSNHEEWAILYFLCQLNTSEPGECMVRCSWSERARMMESGYDFQVPPGWGETGAPETGPEKKGTFWCTYMTETEDSKRPDTRDGSREERYVLVHLHDGNRGLETP